MLSQAFLSSDFQLQAFAGPTGFLPETYLGGQGGPEPRATHLQERLISRKGNFFC